MNKERRAQILQAAGELEDIKTKLKYISRKEEEILDNTPENLQGTDRYSESENAIDVLDDVVDDLESAIESLNEIV